MGSPIVFQLSRGSNVPKGLVGESHRRQPFNRFCGFWKGGRFREIEEIEKAKIPNSESTDTVLLQEKERPFETLKIYGDSMARRFYASISQNHTLCKRLFKRCILSNIWVYKMYNLSRDRYEGVHRYDDQGFNQSKYLLGIREDLESKDMLTGSSVYVFNFGVHSVMTLQMERLVQLLHEVMKMITKIKEENGGQFPFLIWKSTTAPCLENFKPEPSTQLRFLTKQVPIFYFGILVFQKDYYGRDIRWQDIFESLYDSFMSFFDIYFTSCQNH